MERINSDRFEIISLNDLYLGKKVVCRKCKKGIYEPVNGGKVISGFKCNNCGNFIEVCPGEIIIE